MNEVKLNITIKSNNVTQRRVLIRSHLFLLLLACQARSAASPERREHTLLVPHTPRRPTSTQCRGPRPANRRLVSSTTVYAIAPRCQLDVKMARLTQAAIIQPSVTPSLRLLLLRISLPPPPTPPAPPAFLWGPCLLHAAAAPAQLKPPIHTYPPTGPLTTTQTRCLP
jgi:hypothetical protein